MGPLADSTLGARYLGTNPWVTAASPRYLERVGSAAAPGDLDRHQCLVYSSVQGDDVWHYTDPKDGRVEVSVRGRLRSNNLSTVLAATRAHMGVAILPMYVAREALERMEIATVLDEYTLPSQEMHAVYPSPKLVSAKVLTLIGFLAERLAGQWWRPRTAE